MMHDSQGENCIFQYLNLLLFYLNSVTIVAFPGYAGTLFLFMRCYISQPKLSISSTYR